MTSDVTSGPGTEDSAAAGIRAAAGAVPPAAGPSVLLPEKTAARPHQPVIALTFLAGAVVIAPLMDALAKSMGDEASVLQMVWFRFAVHALLFLPLILWKFGPSAYVKPAGGYVQILRSAFLAGSSFAFFSAIQTIPIADALGVAFIESFVVALFSILILKEPVGWRRMTAIAVGFLGVLIVLRPGFGMTAGHAWALGAGFCFGGYFALSRFLSGQAPTLITMAQTPLIGALVMTGFMLANWQPVTDPVVFGKLVLIGVLAAVVHGCFQMAFERADAAFVAVFAYTEILTATLFGWMFFSDFPDAMTWAGLTVLVSAGVFLVIRERQVEAQSGS